MKSSFEERKDVLYEIERNFYGAFSGIHRGEGFKAYHRMEYGNITDCNHAVLDLSNNYFRRRDIIEASLTEMEEFYEFMGLKPRLYQGFYEGEFDLLAPLLSQRGYVVETFKETELYVFDATNFESDVFVHVPKQSEGFVELLTSSGLSRNLFDDVDGHSDWYEILCEMIESTKYRVFAIVQNEEMISLATAHSFGDLCRIDHVKTANAHRNKGFCRKLMNGMMNVLVGEEPEVLYYLYASKPEAIKPYLNSGFRKVASDGFIWGAWKV